MGQGKGRGPWLTIALLGLCLLIGLSKDAFSQEAHNGNGLDSDEGADTGVLESVSSLAGGFTQVIRDEQGRVISEAQGTFAILKPHFFRWFIESPGQQLILSDGVWLWQHDLDLETVTRQPIDTKVSSPLRLLMEPATALAEDYHVTQQADGLSLVPKTTNPFFETLTLTMDAGLPSSMIMLDNLGQTITVTLSVDRDRPLAASDFVFVPPEGPDLDLGGNSG